MNLNTLTSTGTLATKKRVGRGIGSGLGKTSGRGHKGQKARSGGYHKINFEGGQMPIQRRLPKLGFKSRVMKLIDEVTLAEISKLNEEIITIDSLKKAGVVNKSIKSVKIIKSGDLNTPVKLKGLRVTKGARKIIEDLGGSVEE